MLTVPFLSVTPLPSSGSFGSAASFPNACSQPGSQPYTTTKLEAVYFTLGERDVLVLCECPDNASAASLGLAASASGLVRTKITPLLTVEELDQTIAKGVNYRPPGT
jgi:hypothetical protein